LELVPGSVTEITDPAAMGRAFDELIRRGSRRTGLGHELCVALVRQILLMAREDSLEVGLADTRAFQTYRRVREVIERHHLEITTLEGIAGRCNLDAAYLCRLFSRFQEETPYQHLTRLRMEHAARRLIEGDLSVKAVSEELGFRDPFHFSRVFKSVHRVPPSQFQGGRKDRSLGSV
jgi:AraC-like DNA-binding protein